ncbi:MAG: glycerophosphodiester phosphodiesterase family protein [Rhizobiaceae bacterium]
MDSLTPAPGWITSLPIAHRGYHDMSEGRPENSLGAFHAAMEAGFAIECDLQGTKTGEPVVFHDPVLGRMTGREGKVKDYTLAELAKFKLIHINDGIHSLREHLDLVEGKVPLVLECKAQQDREIPFLEGVAKALDGYDGQVCVMSFNHKICSYFKQILPNVPRGLTAEGGDEDYEKHLTAMKLYDLQFVSYHVTELPNRFCKDIHDVGLPVISWTVRDEAARETTAKYADQMTFEGFDPRELRDGG